MDTMMFTDANSADAMTWTITDNGFKMTLSRHVPDLLSTSLGPITDQLLARNGLSRSEVGHWAVHPGGPRILDVVADRLDLQPSDLEPSRHVLATHGNCSSATMLLVLEEVWNRSSCADGDYVVALTFGPGLTLCAALLRATKAV
jgi:predicted naringenin-chalcone synthase